jgi:hypothetical protein
MGATGGGAASDGGQARTAPGLGGRLRGDREQVQQRLEAAGVAPHPAREREQLQELNDISRQIAPGVPVPAPAVEDGGRR